MTYRNDIEALAARQAVLAADVATKTRELESTSQILEEARAKAKLPVLPNIRVASPCPADWKAMTPVGDERVRHCGSCEKNVYNLSEMTREEAEQLILAQEGRLCVRYYQRKDGTILLKDCEIGVSKKRKRRLIAAGAAALLAGGGGAAMMMRGSAKIAPPADATHVSDYDVIQGGIQPEPEPIVPMHDPEVVPMQGQMIAPDVHEVMGTPPPLVHHDPVKHNKASKKAAR